LTPSTPSQIQIPVWGLCPFRSPVFPPQDTGPAPRVFTPRGESQAQGEPRPVLGPCLYAGCALWKITEVKDGKPSDGMCSLRFAAEALNSIAGNLDAMAKRAKIVPLESLPSA